MSAPCEMISLRDYRLASTTGHVVVFEANVPTMIPAALVPEALACGAILFDPNSTPVFDDNKRARMDFEGNLRRSLIYLAMNMLVEENASKNFDGGGVPREAVVSDLLNLSVGKKEVGEVYQELLTARSENRPFGVHPRATDALRIIQATTKAELYEVGEEMGIDQEKLKGKQIRDIKKVLFDGIDGAILG